MNLLLIFYITLFVLVLLVFRDLLPEITLRLQRLNLCKKINFKEYYLLVNTFSIKSLLSPKRVRVNDVRRLMILDDVRYLIKGDPFVFSWPNAWLSKGLLHYYEVSKDERALEVVRSYYAKFIDSEGKLKIKISKVDQIVNGENLIYLSKITGNSYSPAINDLYEFLSSRISNGLVLYRENINVLFVDTLAMICPFLAKFGKLFNNRSAIDLSVFQIKDFLKYGIEPRTRLPFHGYSVTGNFPVGMVGWGRGVGWYCLGLIDTYCELPESDDKELIRNKICEVAVTLKDFQSLNGGYSGILNYSSPFDSSSTAMIVYFLCRALKYEIIGREYADCLNNAVQSLIRHTHCNGMVDFSQTDCMGIGRVSMLYEPTTFAQGMVSAAVSLYFSLDI